MRILVVEDNDDGGQTLVMLLSALGHDVTRAFDGESGVLMYRDTKPEVVIMDLGLPGITGHEATRRIRLEDSDAAPMIIALTGWGRESDIARSGEVGIDHHLVKPLDLAVLRALLDERARQS